MIIGIAAVHRINHILLGLQNMVHQGLVSTDGWWVIRYLSDNRL